MKGPGSALQGWRDAMWRWRRTGDVSALAEAAAGMDPHWRHAVLDMLPSGLRNDVAGLLRRRTVEIAGGSGMAA
jgi:hypothetical protein